VVSTDSSYNDLTDDEQRELVTGALRAVTESLRDVKAIMLDLENGGPSTPITQVFHLHLTALNSILVGSVAVQSMTLKLLDQVERNTRPTSSDSYLVTCSPTFEHQEDAETFKLGLERQERGE
jgi:hypothetical protein